MKHKYFIKTIYLGLNEEILNACVGENQCIVAVFPQGDEKWFVICEEMIE